MPEAECTGVSTGERRGESTGDERECRICFDSEISGNALVSPCDCTGTQRWVHVGCIQRWQRVLVFNQVGTTWRALSAQHDDGCHLVCRTCQARFTGELSVLDRTHLLTSMCGKDLAASLVPGSMLVATPAMSNRPILPMAGIPAALSLLLELKRAHWRSSVYLIVRVTATNPADAGSDTVIALNLTRPQNGEPSQPIPDEVLRRQELEEQRRQTGQPYLEISHFNGGPVAWSSTRHALLATSATQDALQEDSLMIWPRPDGSSVVCGTFSNVVNFARCCCDGAATGTQLRSFSGYAQWSRAQLLHEIARGSWGVVGATIGVENALPNPGEVWSAMSDLAVHAQDNELSSQYVVNS